MIKTLKDGLANILLVLLKTTDKLDEKVISLVNAIDKAIDVSTPKASLYPRLVSGFDEECKDAQMKARKLKKIWKKEVIEESWEEFRLARAEKGQLIAKVKKKVYCESRAKACSSFKELWKAIKHAKNRISR